MFAGIVERMGAVAEFTPTPGGARLRIEAPGYFADLPAGASVAINGACMTMVSHATDVADFDVITESLRLTNLGDLSRGDAVNLERSLRVGDRIDGHFVQGHVEAAGPIVRIEQSARETKLWVEIPPAIRRYVVRKGSIALDGVSLTIVDVEPDRLSVALIPTTLEKTTLGRRREGERVNIESDVLSRLIVERLESWLADPSRPIAGMNTPTDLLDPSVNVIDPLAQLRERGRFA